MQNTAISLTNVNKWFDNFHVLKDINLTVNTGEKVVICGPSGSGKSTVVRCINKLEEHQSGFNFTLWKRIKKYAGIYQLNSRKCWNGISTV